MIDMQLLDNTLMALAILVSAAITLTAVITIAAAAGRPRQAPRQPPNGGIRRDLPQDPAPDHDDARELVLR